MSLGTTEQNHICELIDYIEANLADIYVKESFDINPPAYYSLALLPTPRAVRHILRFLRENHFPALGKPEL